MTAEAPTIDQALATFLSERHAAVRPDAFRNYADIVDLLKGSLNGYAYDSLDRFGRRRWEQAFEAGDEQAFTRLFGPDKIPGHLGEFLGYFMIRKVIAPEDVTSAAGRVTKELVEWLAARGWIAADVVADAVERSEDAARDLPLAERLGELLYQQAKRSRINQAELDDEDYLEDYMTIERVEPTALWFEGDIGPVPVPVPPRSSLSRAGQSTSCSAASVANGTSSRSATFSREPA